jgi:hypothetical protein
MIALDQLAGCFGLTLTGEIARPTASSSRHAANGFSRFPDSHSCAAAPAWWRSTDRCSAIGMSGWCRSISDQSPGPSIGQPIVIRRASKLILVGGVQRARNRRHVERTATGARVVITMQPPTPYRVARDGNRLIVPL